MRRLRARRPGELGDLPVGRPGPPPIYLSIYFSISLYIYIYRERERILQNIKEQQHNPAKPGHARRRPRARRPPRPPAAAPASGGEGLLCAGAAAGQLGGRTALLAVAPLARPPSVGAAAFDGEPSAKASKLAAGALPRPRRGLRSSPAFAPELSARGPPWSSCPSTPPMHGAHARAPPAPGLPSSCSAPSAASGGLAGRPPASGRPDDVLDSEVGRGSPRGRGPPSPRGARRAGRRERRERPEPRVRDGAPSRPMVSAAAGEGRSAEARLSARGASAICGVRCAPRKPCEPCGSCARVVSDARAPSERGIISVPWSL